MRSASLALLAATAVAGANPLPDSAGLNERASSEQQTAPPAQTPVPQKPSKKPLPPKQNPVQAAPPNKGEVGKVTTGSDAIPVKSSRKGSFVKFLSDQVFSRIQLSGSRSIGYHSHKVEGDQEAFNLNTTYGLGEKRWTDIGSVAIQGRQVLGIFNFDAVIQDSRFQDPQGQKFSLDYDKNGLSVNLGDIRGRLLNSNRFVTFNKTLRGGMVGYKSGSFEARALYTQVRGEARTITIAGANSSGPYFLQSNQVLRGSEQIEVDGVSQEFGQDYIIDYDLGSVTFINRSTGQGKIISPTSVITATYESFGLTGSRGQVGGIGASYGFGKYGKLGLNFAAQKAGGESRLSTRVESFQGFGAPGTPYFLQFEPLASEAIIIRVDGVLQVENLDYTIDPANRSIFYFTRFMPSTSTIDVIYTPKPTQTVNGDRQIIGIDYTVPFGKGTSLTVAQAASRLTNTPTPKSGTARLAELRYSVGRLKGYAAMRTVPESFVGIETTGFSRNEKSVDLNLEYALKKGLSTSLTHRNSAISQTTVDSNGDERINPTRFVTTQARLDFLPSAGGSPWSLNHARTFGRNVAGDSQVDSTTLTTSRNFGRFQTRWELNNQFGAAPSVVAGEGRQKFSRQGLDLRGSYEAGKNISGTFSAGLSRIAVAGDSGLGRDFQLGLGWRPKADTSVNLSYTDSDSGNVNAVSGFTSGWGLGYNGNGFSGGASGNPILGVASLRRLALTSRFRPRENFSLATVASISRSSGSVSSNTESATLALNADWDAFPWLQLSGTSGLTNTKYVDSSQSSRAVSFSLLADGAPPGRLSFGLGLSGLLSTGSEFGQDVLQTDARLSYLLIRRHRVSLTYSSSRSTGYLPQDDFDLALSYRYEIWRGLGLSLSHRWRKVTNRDSSTDSGAYRSRGFDIELGFNFGR